MFGVHGTSLTNNSKLENTFMTLGFFYKELENTHKSILVTL